MQTRIFRHLPVRAIFGSALSCLFASSLDAARTSTAPVVRVAQGRLEGAPLGNGGAEFRGIPFAAPPVGPLRWQAPKPARAWIGLRPARSFGHSCMQIDGGWNHDAAADADEDCLYLNVYTPDLRPKAKLPVMVWIYGGAFSGGSGSQAIYQSQSIVARGVILVTINYRLNIFGFFAHPDMQGAVRANFGLTDQIAALRWIKANIAAFGGNPTNVTVFGQSAGGMSVIDLMTSPAARTLFGKAIVESGVMLKLPPPSLAAAQQRGAKFAAGMSLDQLRALSAADLLARYKASQAEAASASLLFGPVIDGRILPADPAAVFSRHQEVHVPLLIGNNAREALGRPQDLNIAAELRRSYGVRAAEAAALYSDAPLDPVLGTPANRFMTDTGFRCSTVIMAARHAAGGSPTWQYQFEQSLPGLEEQGAQHSFELPYVFGSLPVPGAILGGAYTAADRGLSDRMIDYWTHFARTGDPNGRGRTTWPKLDSSHAYLRFATGLNQDAEASHGLRQAQCALFEQSLD